MLRALSMTSLRAPVALRMAPVVQFTRPMCDAAGELSSGTVKWFDTKKGFGFITPSSGGPDVFVHQSEIHAPGFRSLADGEEVSYKMTEQDDGRLRATEVTGPDGNYVQGAPAPDLEQY